MKSIVPTVISLGHIENRNCINKFYAKLLQKPSEIDSRYPILRVMNLEKSLK